MIQAETSYLYEFFAALEAVLVLAGVTLILFLRNRRHRRRIGMLEQALREARSRFRVIREKGQGTAAAEADYPDQLEVQLKASRALLGEDVFEHLHPPTGDETGDRKRLLAIRHRFLELERHAQLVGEDPQARESHWAKGIEDLLARVLPETGHDAGGEGKDGPAGPEEGNTFHVPLDRLHHAVQEQRGVIAELRTLLETELADSEQAGEILQRLEQAEAQTQEIESLLARIEGGRSGEAEDGHDVDADQLRELVGNQQNTIAQLESMLQGALSGDRSPEELEAVLSKIQRTNMELGTCVTVLEDENARLRDEIAALQDRVAELESAGGDAGQAAQAAGTEAAGGDPVPAEGADRETPADARSMDMLENRIEPPEEVDLDEPPAEETAVCPDEGETAFTPDSDLRERKTGTDDATPSPPSPPPSRPGWTNDL